MSARRLAAFALRLVAAFALSAWTSRPAPAAETYAYDTIGRMTDVVYANGSSIHYTYDANGNLLSIVTSGTTGVPDPAAPLTFSLGPCTPNPGSGERTIAFSTPTRGFVTLRVFDVAGREVAALLDRSLDPQRYVAHFSTDRWGGGVYFYRLSLSGRTLKGRLVVVR